LTAPFAISEIGWLNVTNAALGIAVAVFFGFIGVAALRDLFPRLRFRWREKQMDAEVRRLLAQYRL
jgi:peroxiredoxin family protein